MLLTIATLLAAAQEPPPPEARLVCRYEERTGTRFKSHVCHTRAGWDAIAAAAQRNVHDMADRPAIPLYNPSAQERPNRNGPQF
jgi:hypothetical protein